MHLWCVCVCVCVCDLLGTFWTPFHTLLIAQKTKLTDCREAFSGNLSCPRYGTLGLSKGCEPGLSSHCRDSVVGWEGCACSVTMGMVWRSMIDGSLFHSMIHPEEDFLTVYWRLGCMGPFKSKAKAASTLRSPVTSWGSLASGQNPLSHPSNCLHT